MQHVDQVVNVLDTALRAQRRAQLSATTTTTTETTTSNSKSSDSEPATTAVPPQLQELDPSKIAQTAEGARLLAAEQDKAILSRRSGRGPKQGEILRDNEQPTAISAGEQDRKRLRLVADQVRELGTFAVLERWKAEMPSEAEMLPRDKYTIFDRKARGYRKGIHSELAFSSLSLIMPSAVLG